jgi:hypothetical protein
LGTTRLVSTTGEWRMLYRKNLYTWEQALRALVAVAALIYGALFAWGTLLGYAALATGMVLLVTGAVGWCPACAMFGKKLKTGSS